MLFLIEIDHVWRRAILYVMIRMTYFLAFFQWRPPDLLAKLVISWRLMIKDYTQTYAIKYVLLIVSSSLS